MAKMLQDHTNDVEPMRFAVDDSSAKNAELRCELAAVTLNSAFVEWVAKLLRNKYYKLQAYRPQRTWAWHNDKRMRFAMHGRRSLTSLGSHTAHR